MEQTVPIFCPHVYRCKKKCDRKLCPLGHPCTKKCFQDCGLCLYKVEKTIPMCGHVATMKCRRDPHTWDCQDRCKGTLSCGHQCSGICGDCRKKNRHIIKCTEEVSVSNSLKVKGTHSVCCFFKETVQCIIPLLSISVFVNTGLSGLFFFYVTSPLLSF